MAGEKPHTVFDRKLAFDELNTLKEMVPGLKKAAGLKQVDILQVTDGGKKGTLIGRAELEALPQIAEQAVPGAPSLHSRMWRSDVLSLPCMLGAWFCIRCGP